MYSNPPRVFAVQQPTGRDDSGRVVPSMDLTPAETFGDLIFVLREQENPFSDPQGTLDRIVECLRDNEFCEHDWVLLVGNPVLIGLMSIAAIGLSDKFRVLQWKRAAGVYAPVEVQVSDEVLGCEPA